LKAQFKALVLGSVFLLITSFAFADNCEYIEKKNPPAQQQPSNPDHYNPSNFPTTPDPVMTPGKLCEHGVKRYAEGITYCERDVDTKLKNKIINEYDQKLGFHIRTMNRNDFKIDHFIPLSIGGSNSQENLWPQHKSVYAYSDKIEGYLHELMEKSRIKQAEAIELIKTCKLNLGRCGDIEDHLKKLND
jgi:hypothetical protein